MQDDQPRISAVETKLTLHLADCSAGAFRGWVHSDYFEKDIPFADCFTMLKIMDHLYDALSFPQKTFQLRTFQRRETDKFMVKETVIPVTEESRTTFVIQVKFRQNATWQGSIHWVEKNQTRSFRSTLEMIKLIDESVPDGETPEIRWD